MIGSVERCLSDVAGGVFLKGTTMNTDSQLQTDVLAELKWQPGFNAAHIGVTAKNHAVTLTGQVCHYAEKLAAQDAAQRVFGVNDVANDIRVEMPGSFSRSDQDIAEAALNAIKWDVQIPTDSVKVIVDHGNLVLKGAVDWHFQRIAAERCVQYLMGVQLITNCIEIKPTEKWIDVKSRIEDAFRRSADMDARRIYVATNDGNVILTGSVSSYRERDEAVAAAWAAPGVTSVSDGINIMY